MMSVDVVVVVVVVGLWFDLIPIISAEKTNNEVWNTHGIVDPIRSVQQQQQQQQQTNKHKNIKKQKGVVKKNTSQGTKRKEISGVCVCESEK